jgi:O-antigen/teichoic acid export membrane protein
LKAYLAALFGFLVLRSDLFMVEHMLGPEQAGYYSIAFAMADYVSVLAVVIAAILFPKLSAVSDVGVKLKMTRRAVRGTAALLVPLLFLSALVAKPAVRILFGPPFMPAALAFILLMPGMLFLGLNMVGVQFLNSMGYPKSVVLVWAACTIVNIAANVWAIPHYGIAGASAVSTVSYFLAFFFNNQIIRRTEARFRSGSIATA